MPAGQSDTKQIFKALYLKRVENSVSSNDTMQVAQQIELPAEEIEVQVLNNLVTLGLVTEQEKESLEAMTCCTSDKSAVILVYDQDRFTIVKANAVRKWLLDKDILFTQTNPPDENCFFFFPPAIHEIAMQAKALR